MTCQTILIGTILTLPCLAAQSQAPSRPTLVQTDSIVLIDTDSQFVGAVSGFATARNGRMFVADKANTVVHEFSSSGQRLRTFGRRGRGPGEFTLPTALAVAADTLLFVNGLTSLEVFDLRTGKHVWQRRLPAMQRIDGLTYAAGHLYFAAFNRGLKTSVGRVQGASDSAALSGPFPQPYGQRNLIDDVFGRVGFSVFGGDSVAAVFHASDFLYLGRFGVARADSIHLPRTARNGARPDVISKVSDDPATVQPFLYSLSAPWAVSPSVQGRISIVHVDQTLLNGRMAGKLFLSVVNTRKRLACTDAELPIPADPPGWASFRADTLIVVQQDETRDRQPRTIVRKFVAKAGACQ